jgi:spermidine synthase
LKKLERLDQATAPDGTVLTLYRHDGAYVIRVDEVELMSTRRHNSEDRLAELVCAPLRERTGVRVLIGGLGLGFTLKAALRELAPDARVVVAEIVDTVVVWNRNPDYGLSVAALDDPRVELRHGDVADVLRSSPEAFDAIMLDVDNGAEPLIIAGNGQLYRDAGIRQAVAALRPGGQIAYWSVNRDPDFETSLRGAGLAVDVTKSRAHATSGPWHTLYVARRNAQRER